MTVTFLFGSGRHVRKQSNSLNVLTPIHWRRTIAVVIRSDVSVPKYRFLLISVDMVVGDQYAVDKLHRDSPKMTVPFLIPGTSDVISTRASPGITETNCWSMSLNEVTAIDKAMHADLQWFRRPVVPNLLGQFLHGLLRPFRVQGSGSGYSHFNGHTRHFVWFWKSADFRDDLIQRFYLGLGLEALPADRTRGYSAPISPSA